MSFSVCEAVTIGASREVTLALAREHSVCGRLSPNRRECQREMTVWEQDPSDAPTRCAVRTSIGDAPKVDGHASGDLAQVRVKQRRRRFTKLTLRLRASVGAHCADADDALSQRQRRWSP